MSGPNEGQRGLGPPSRGGVVTARRGENLADILERVLDKGIVIAGDITISLATVELLSIKIRLLITSVDKAREIGINWWQHDRALTSPSAAAHDDPRVDERLNRLERKLDDAIAALPPRRDRRLQRERARARLRARRGERPAVESSPEKHRKGT